jgi:hypothetical protein
MYQLMYMWKEHLCRIYVFQLHFLTKSTCTVQILGTSFVMKLYCISFAILGSGHLFDLLLHGSIWNLVVSLYTVQAQGIPKTSLEPLLLGPPILNSGNSNSAQHFLGRISWLFSRTSLDNQQLINFKWTIPTVLNWLCIAFSFGSCR